ncbi:hypothetical protein LF817_18540 [Halobacillus sp. A1]|uniref:Lipoyl-binding domain-containing protein n=1 Tax=Halobacillus campisalis TaxID=435909 RepID=A0ABW2K0K3_9BACI|nr:MULTISPECIES: hypothetical protein [Halobacillus]MCP3033328.1 hypothetical protein [Halobacillus sp. A1]
MKEVLEKVYSPCYGSIKEVLVDQQAYVYEWEPLFLIETEDQQVIEVSIGVSGIIEAVDTCPGQEVTPESVLTILKDDLQIGSD